MSKTRQRYDEEFKKNAVKLSYASSKTVKEVADDLGINISLLYRLSLIHIYTGIISMMLCTGAL